MAGKRPTSRTGRSAPSRAPLRGTLGTLVNTALSQAGVLRDVLERGAREGRARLDDVRTNRKRQDALAELGEIVLELIRKGEIDVAELPEAKPLVRYLDDLDEAGDGASDDEELAEVVRPSRKRFDDREDGTVAARPSDTSSARPWAPRKPATAAERVWRPVADEPTPDEPAPPAASSREPRRLPNNPARKGGIAFDDDDLSEYMHPDDVPTKPSPDGDS